MKAMIGAIAAQNAAQLTDKMIGNLMRCCGENASGLAVSAAVVGVIGKEIFWINNLNCERMRKSMEH